VLLLDLAGASGCVPFAMGGAAFAVVASFWIVGMSVPASEARTSWGPPAEASSAGSRWSRTVADGQMLRM
jgi:hypothetical protein